MKPLLVAAMPAPLPPAMAQLQLSRHRGDILAVDLLITGAGINLNAGAPGATPLAIAESRGRQGIVPLLKTSGAR